MLLRSAASDLEVLPKMSNGERIATLIIGIVGLILMGIQAWDILDRRGVMNAAIAICVWLLSLSMVAYAVYKNLRDVHREKYIRAEIITIRDEHKTQIEALKAHHRDGMASVRADANRNAEIVKSKQDEIHEMQQRHTEALKNVKLSLFEEIQAKYGEPKKWDAPFRDNASGLRIESAIYGSPGHTRDVSDRVRAMLPKGSGEFIVRNNDLCNDDPSENVYKFLTVTFSVTQGQDRILVIPELPARTALSINQVKAVTAAPQLLVEYLPQKPEPLEDELLRFANEGPGTIKDIKVGPLTWIIRHRREINLHNVMGPLRPQQHIDCKFAAYEQRERMQHISLLTTILREAAPDAETEVTISYRDLSGNGFSRRFLLTIDPYNQIAWDPCPVQPETDAAEAH